MKGFTLVEMMVALFVFGLLAGAGVGVLAYAARGQEAVSAHSDRAADFRRMRGLLRADLAQAAARRTRGADGLAAREVMAGGGAGEGATVLSLARRGLDNPDGRPRADVQFVDYRLERGVLTRRARPALDGAPLGAPQRLYDGVSNLKIAFLMSGRWLADPAQGQAGVLPEAVRIDADYAGLGPVSQLFLVTGERP